MESCCSEVVQKVSTLDLLCGCAEHLKTMRKLIISCHCRQGTNMSILGLHVNHWWDPMDKDRPVVQAWVALKERVMSCYILFQPSTTPWNYPFPRIPHDPNPDPDLNLPSILFLLLLFYFCYHYFETFQFVFHNVCITLVHQTPNGTWCPNPH